jgi:drug/metabolite transporter (DMT)-like permease
VGVRNFLTLLFTAAIFGSSFMFVRIAVPDFGPVVLMDARLILAGAVLLLFAVLTRHRLSLGGRGAEWLLLGGITFGLPFTLLGWAQLHVTASLAAIFIATAPLYTALVAALWMRERLTRKKLAGLALGLIGVAILTGWSPIGLDATTALALLMLLAVPMFYAVGTVYIRQRFHHLPPLDVTIFTLLAAGVLLLPLVPFSWPAAPPSMAATLAFLALTFLCTSFAFVMFFRLIATVGPVSTSTAGYLIPLFGAFWGAVFLNEPITPTMLLAFAIILASVALVTGVRLPQRRAVAA